MRILCLETRCVRLQASETPSWAHLPVVVDLALLVRLLSDLPKRDDFYEAITVLVLHCANVLRDGRRQEET